MNNTSMQLMQALGGILMPTEPLYRQRGIVADQSTDWNRMFDMWRENAMRGQRPNAAQILDSGMSVMQAALRGIRNRRPSVTMGQ